MNLPDPFRPRRADRDGAAALVCALVLVGLGLICVYSFGGGHLVRQLAWALVGTAACLVASRIPLPWIRRAAGPLLAVSAALLLAALLFAPVIAETKRWLLLPGIGTFQPSELAKLAVVIFLADRLTTPEGAAAPLRAAWPAALVCLLILPAPDFGTAIFVAGVAAAMLLVAGARMGGVLAAGAAALPVLLLLAARFPYVADRLRFFRGEESYQVVQAKIALGSGGLFGKGLGGGVQKMGYLPAGHTDFVLPNVGEELGFFGVLVVGALFALLCVHGVRVALAALPRDRFAFHLALGATFVVVFQAVLNIAVATGAAPTKGISLPFLSQGGSNLVVCLLAVGLVVNAGRSVAGGRR